MFSRDVFRLDFGVAINRALERNNLNLKELANLAGIPPVTLYKATNGTRDPRLSTVKALVRALEPYEHRTIAVIGARFLLEGIDNQFVEIENKKFRIKSYSANTTDDCVVAAVTAEKEGAEGIICAPILATLIERIVDIPVVILKPDLQSYRDAIDVLIRQISSNSQK